MAFAKVLADAGYSVDLEWKSALILEKLEKRFGFELGNINVVPSVKKGSGYDLCFWVSDGSVPLLSARKNLLLFQAPFHNVEGKNLLNKMKFFRINKVLCYSEFVKKIIDEEYGIKSMVIYPPVDISTIKPKRKENIILYVGRFSRLLQAKRQDILIKAFKKLSDRNLNKDWKLILTGGIEIGAGDYLKELKKQAEGDPIEFIESPFFKEVIGLYGKAKIFWSAAGFGVDEKKDPEKLEHFGLTTVEAMAAGAVPLVFAAGGQKEIIKNNVNGFLWNEINELIKLTRKLINERKLLNELAQKARNSAQIFGYARFEKEVSAII